MRDGEREYGPAKPSFKKAHVRIFGVFSEEDRRRIAAHDDIGGNLVVTIRDNEITVAFDQSDHVYVAWITPR